MFGVVVLFLSARQISLTPSFNNPIIVINVFFCMVALVLSSVMHMIYRKIITTPADVRSALQKYQAFCVTRWAIIEGGALLSAVVTLVTKNILPVCFFIVCLVFLIYRYPSQQEFISLTKNQEK